MRLANNLFTVSVGGGGKEHRLRSLTGLQHVIETEENTESDRLDVIRNPGHINEPTITITDAPLQGLQCAVGNWMAEIRMEGNLVAHARAVTGMGVTWEVGDNRELDKIVTQKWFGKMSYNDIVLRQVQDVDDDLAFWNWIKMLGEPTGPGGQNYSETAPAEDARKDLIITLQNAAKESVGSFRIVGAFHGTYSVSDLDATGNEALIHELTLHVSGRGAGMGVKSEDGAFIPDLSYPSPEGNYDPAFNEWVDKIFKKPEYDTMLVKVYKRGAMVGADQPTRVYKLLNAWPSEVNYGDIDADSNATFTRDVVVAYDAMIQVK